MNQQFDQLTRSLAQSVTGRGAVRKFGLGLAGMGLACLLSLQASAQTGPIAPPPGLVAWWAGDGDARDLAGTNHGVLYSGVEFTAGMVGQAFGFHRTGAQVLAAAVGLPIGGADRSIECWARIDQFEADFPHDSVFCGYGPPGSYGASYALAAESVSVFWSQWGQSIVGPPVTTGVWYHVAVTSSSGFTTLFLNGAEVANGSVPFNTPEGPPFFMGYVGPGRALDGALDEISVYNRALSANEVMAIYQAGNAGKIKPEPHRQLHITASGNIVLVWWPASASGFVLESSAGLGAGQIWARWSGPVLVIGDQNLVATNTDAERRFFRLRKL